MYMLSTPLLKSIKFPLVCQTWEDFLSSGPQKQRTPTTADDMDQRKGENLKVNDQRVPLPKCLQLSQLGVSSIFKKAGPLSNKNSASCTMWTLAHRNELHCVKKTWVGREVLPLVLFSIPFTNTKDNTTVVTSVDSSSNASNFGSDLELVVSHWCHNRYYHYSYSSSAGDLFLIGHMYEKTDGAEKRDIVYSLAPICESALAVPMTTRLVGGKVS